MRGIFSFLWYDTERTHFYPLNLHVFSFRSYTVCLKIKSKNLRIDFFVTILQIDFADARKKTIYLLCDFREVFIASGSWENTQKSNCLSGRGRVIGKKEGCFLDTEMEREYRVSFYETVGHLFFFKFKNKVNKGFKIYTLCDAFL